MARLKTRMRRKRRRDDETSLLPKSERADWAGEWQREMKVWDRIGFAVSVLCMMHCVATPVAFAVSPTLRIVFGGVNIHAWLAGIVLFVTFATFIPSFLQHHRAGVLAMALLGLCFVAFAAISDGCCRPSAGKLAVDRTPTPDLVRPDVGVQATEAVASELTLTSLWNRWVTPLGGALLAIAHVLNARFRRRCGGGCEANHKHDAPASGDRARRLETPRWHFGLFLKTRW